jgi:hypothetical protein
MDCSVLTLKAGMCLAETTIPGLLSAQPGGTVAEVVAHPQDPTVLGLRNDSQVAWRVQTGGAGTLSQAREEPAAEGGDAGKLR